MKTIFYLSILFVTVTMMSSCENELPFNINNNPPKLVMNALINAESTDNLLFLNFTSKENSTHVQNVTVEVRINGELKESLRPLPPETEGNPQCRFGITSRFTPGDAVRIDAITDDGQYHAWTEINVPQRPFEIENVDTVTVPLAQSGYTTEYLRYRITINDRPNETNYYRIVIDKQTTLWDITTKKEETITSIGQNTVITSLAARMSFLQTDNPPPVMMKITDYSIQLKIFMVYSTTPGSETLPTL